MAIAFVLRTPEEDSTAFYNAACTYALANDLDNAILYLRKAFEDGFCRLHHISVDTDFDAIRDTEEFQELVAEYTQKIKQNWQARDTATIGEERIVEVPFTAANGVTKVNCTINGLPLNFVFDTGASDVTISQVEANFMFKNGYLSDKDIIGKQHYQTADGNISVGTVINLGSINFGGLSLTNVRASVVQSQNAPLLLGQSVLQRLGKIEIDNEQRLLKITTTTL
jgi:clan AA aspartic protease (TIGR02281 family)